MQHPKLLSLAILLIALLLMAACGGSRTDATANGNTATAIPIPSPVLAPLQEISPTSVTQPDPIPSATHVPETPEPVTDLSQEVYPTPTEIAFDFTIPPLTLHGGTGDIVCSIYQDSEGNPALVAHWTLDVEPGSIGMVDYPFVAGDTMEMSVYGQKIRQAYMESPDGGRTLEINDTLRPWEGEVQAESDGWHRFYFDNTDGDSVKTMHLVITYHDAAPDSVLLAPNETDVRIALPLPESGS